MKFIKYLVLLLLLLAVVGFIAVKAFSVQEPKGLGGAEADSLALEVMHRLNKPAFDTLPYLQWEFFRAGQKYFWDKKQNKAVIEWGDNKVVMDLDSQEAQCYTSGVEQSGAAHDKLKAKAWSNWCNDSFWLIAPFKMMDPGTTRELVELESGGKGIKVTYGGGGVTPGDSYLWELDKNLRPTGWKMWTSIIPVKGIYSKWSGWEEHQGIPFSTKHTIFGKEVVMRNVKAGSSLQDFGYSADPFR